MGKVHKQGRVIVAANIITDKRAKLDCYSCGISSLSFKSTKDLQN